MCPRSKAYQLGMTVKSLSAVRSCWVVEGAEFGENLRNLPRRAAGRARAAAAAGFFPGRADLRLGRSGLHAGHTYPLTEPLSSTITKRAISSGENVAGCAP
jgi:hypothetical protein